MKLLAAFVILLIILTACIGDDDDERADTIDAPTSTAVPATPTPVATKPPSPTETAETVEATTTTEVELPVTETPELAAEPTVTLEVEATPTEASEEEQPEEELAESLLLRIEDMPSGWTTSDLHIDDDDDSDSDSTICDTPPIEETLDTSGVAETSYQRSQTGPFIQQLIALFDSEDDAAEAVEFLRTAFNCEEWHTEDDEGEPVIWRLAPLSFPSVGDETFALRANVDSGGFAFEVDLIVIRESRAFVLLMQLGFSIETDNTVTISETTVQRVRDGL